LSIKPQYAAAIFSGTKQFEFRRSVFRQPVTTIVIYVTTPVGMVQGEFEVAGMIGDGIDRLWSKTYKVAGIEREAFFEISRVVRRATRSELAKFGNTKSRSASANDSNETATIVRLSPRPNRSHP
jgi:predicted transcriptional regulator